MKDLRDRVLNVADIPFADTRPRVQSVVVMIDPHKLSSLPKKIASMLTEAGKLSTEMVPRGEGVVVLCCEERALWRAHYGEPLGTKRCLACGHEIVGGVVRTRQLGVVGDEVGAFLHFCETCPLDGGS